MGAGSPGATTIPARALTEAERAAYLIVRAPATYAAVSAVLRELTDRCPAFAPGRLLDLGAGPGIGLWAALAHWPGIADATLIEHDRGFVALGREILDASGLAHDRSIAWRALDLRSLAPAAVSLSADDLTNPVVRVGPLVSAADTGRTALATPGASAAHGEPSVVRSSIARAAARAPQGETTSLPAADLTLMSYSLGELPSDARMRALDAAWDATTHALVLIEPGTPRHFAAVLDARARLLQRGATIAAPCPHHGPCPMAAAGDWCHVSARLARSRQHRQLKGGELSYEDEKFSYLIAVRPSAHPLHTFAARIVRHPRFEKGRVTLTLCTATGLRTDTISRHARDAYRLARDARWGDAWAPPDARGSSETTPDEQ